MRCDDKMKINICKTKILDFIKEKNIEIVDR